MALYIHHNPGLGDAIVCNGLVHHFRKRASTPPIVAIKKNHAYSVQQLYRHSAVVIDEVANDQEAFEHSQAHDSAKQAHPSGRPCANHPIVLGGYHLRQAIRA